MATTTLIVDIQYDPRFTDPEGLAYALDRLLETVLSTPGILDKHANPGIGPFFVVQAPRDTPAADADGAGEVAGRRPPSYRLAIDGPMFRAQRQLLWKLADLWRQGLAYLPASKEAHLLEGLIGLTDAITDQAHDRYGVDCLIAEDPS